MTTNSSLHTLPDDVLQRVLAGVPLEDQQATAAACRVFRKVITGPQFLGLRQRYGFAERGIVLVNTSEGVGDDTLRVRMAHKSGVVARTARDFFDGDLRSGSTTDGGAQLFLSTMHGQGTSGQSDILVVDISARRWSRLTSLPVHQYAYCLEWHGGRLYTWPAALHSVQTNPLIRFMRSTKPLGCGRICLRCHMRLCALRRASLATSYSSLAACCVAQIRHCRSMTLPLGLGG